jgi:hypothetical protein
MVFTPGMGESVLTPWSSLNHGGTVGDERPMSSKTASAFLTKQTGQSNRFLMCGRFTVWM